MIHPLPERPYAIYACHTPQGPRMHFLVLQTASDPSRGKKKMQKKMLLESVVIILVQILNPLLRKHKETLAPSRNDLTGESATNSLRAYALAIFAESLWF